MQTIKQEIDKVSSLYPVSLSQKSQGNFEILSTIENVHALASALKLFLRELPEPVIPWEVFSLSYQTSLCLEGW